MPDQVRLPGRWVYVLAMAAIVAAAVTAVVAARAGFPSDVRQRATGPGASRVTLTEPGTYTISYEHRGNGDVTDVPPAIAGMHLELRSDDTGATVQVRAPSAGFTSVDGTTQDDAIAEFAIDRPGTYTLASAYRGGDPGAGVVLAIARGAPEDVGTVVTDVLAAAVLGVAGLVLGLLALLLRTEPGPDLTSGDPVPAALDWAEAVSQRWLPPDAHVRVAAIRAEILRLRPQAVGIRERFVLHRTATDYLPSSLQTYLALPPAAASTVALREGKTALQLLREQLELLAAGVREIGDAADARTSERFVVHGRFLEAVFPREP